MAKRRIHVFLTPGSAMERGVLAGLAAYSHDKPDWQLNMWAGYRARDGAAVSPGTADAAIGRITPAIAEQWSGEPRRPLVNVSRSMEVPGAANVTCDDAAIGRLAAECLLGKGLEHFGWIGVADAGPRYTQFARTLRRRGHHVDRFAPAADEDFHAAQAAWLRGLGVPAGVMAFNDLAAMDLIALARQLDIGIPRHLAVVGVDNDELQTMFSPVAVTSIDPNFTEVGRRAAQTLDAMLQGADPPDEPIRIPPRGLIERESTDFPGELDPLAVAAARLIRRRALEGINVGDVVAALPAARRTLVRRFAEAFGRSIGQEIARVRIEEAKRLLAATDLPLARIAERTGYVSNPHFSKVFRKHVGATPSAYRKQMRASA